ncbi:TadE/TadG family type IV pilus assembly protein [Methylobacterium nonmethylotrophicum]|uniref:TadE/TadG family type IV pilus assembly protein n=1 Tax=Methylobacterium nonmethylotrophicum TaxID=1141884 RepID=UPI0014368342|nr:TadE/TadG family type IV pilus assembly protein [Methylobacterium nonmethylotrophicum]
MIRSAGRLPHGLRRVAIMLAMAARRCEGIAAIEFALVLPALLLLALGISQIGAAVVIQTKMRATSSTIGQIVSQYQTITDSDMSMILGAANAIISPYATAPASIVVSLLAADSTGSGTVVWSSALQGQSRTIGSRLTLPAGMAMDNVFYILGESSYSFTPMVGSAFFKNLQLGDRIYVSPRSGTAIVRTP